MKQAEILHDTFGEPLTLDKMTSELYGKAKDSLGYECKARRTTAATEDGVLRTALRQLEIDTLNENSVRRYQADKLAEAMKQTTGANFDWSWRSGPAWSRKELKDYHQPIPDFAIERAIQIKEACPQVGFWGRGIRTRS